MIERTTPENIKELKENQIFVFGSNLSGRHGKGAAKTALGWGAKYGQANGLQGRTYGIFVYLFIILNLTYFGKILSSLVIYLII